MEIINNVYISSNSSTENENINNIYISSNSNTEKEDVNMEFGFFKIQEYCYISNFPEKTPESEKIKYKMKIIKDKSVFDD